MEERGLDALLATSPENVAWASGAAPPSQKTVRSRLAAALVPRDGESELVAIALEGPVVRAQSRLSTLRLYEEFVEDPVLVFADSLLQRGLGEGIIGVEETHLSHADFGKLASALPQARARPGRRAVRGATDGEDAGRDRCDSRHRRGCRADRGGSVRHLRSRRHGARDRELRGRTLRRGRRRRADDARRRLGAALGRRQRARRPSRVLEDGDIVRLDIIGTKARYHSDVARTMVVGDADRRAAARSTTSCSASIAAASRRSGRVR